jgi:hypothetical protein
MQLPQRLRRANADGGIMPVGKRIEQAANIPGLLESGYVRWSKQSAANRHFLWSLVTENWKLETDHRPALSVIQHNHRAGSLSKYTLYARPQE